MLKRGVYSLGFCAICLFITSIPLFAEGQAIPQQVLDLQKAAKQCTENKDFNLAQEKYQAIILNFPNTNYAMDAQSEIGVLYVKMGQIDKADTVLDTLSTIYKDNPNVVFAAQKVILACEEKKDYNTALTFCQKILGQYGANPEAIRIQGWLAEAHIRLNQTAEADAVIQQMLEEGSEREYVFGSVICNVGEAYLRDLNQPQKAITVYRDFLTRYPGNSHNILTHRKLVEIYHKSGQVDKAVQEIGDFLNRYVGHEQLADIAAGGAYLLYDCKAYDKSIEFCKYSLTKLSGTEKRITLQIYLIRNYLKKGDFTSAEAELKTFFDQYSTSPVCVDKGMILRGAFMQERRYETAARICEKLLKMYPNHEKAFDVLKALWVNYQQTGQVGDLGSVADTLLTQYKDSEDKYLEVAAICSEIYLEGKDYFGALDVSKAAISKYPANAKSVELLSVQACAYLNLSNFSQAKEVVNTLQTVYKYSAGFGKAMNKIGICYRRLGEYAEAMALHQLVLDTKSDPDTELRACEGIGKVYARQGDVQKVLQIADTMTADYKDEQRYPGALFVLGEEFYLMAYEAQKNGDPNAVRTNFEKAIAVLEKVVLSSDVRVLSLMAFCYQQLGLTEKATLLYNKAVAKEPALARGDEPMQMALAGDRYCGAYVVWHLLKYYGKSYSIDDIAIRMNIPQKGFATVQDIVKAFEAYEIPAQAVQIPANKAAQLDTPFVQYRIPVMGSELGHFVLCIPAGNGKAVVLDGVKEPYIIDLSLFDTKDEVWDGTIIMIGQSRKEFIDKELTAQINWKTMLVVGGCWIDGGGDCYDRIGLYYSGLNEQKQAYLRGGCSGDLDCNNVGPNCYVRQTCNKDSDCYGYIVACDDLTQEEECQWSGSWGMPCTYDAAHNCGPKKVVAPKCGGTVCTLDRKINDYCTGFARQWIHQCHDGW